ncbi:MAG: hypothetical protein H6872_11100 [Methylobacteriaceae bacterium]|nr:hypothetical protein [Rhodoblastus sp.]MCC0005661.1 hypothetical protein [Methylobacteriaceae bacterium]
MTTAPRLTVLAFALLAASGVAQAQEKKKPSCRSIFNICMKRAGSGHAAICEDMYAMARSKGEWQETQDENGVRYPAMPCTP